MIEIQICSIDAIDKQNYSHFLAQLPIEMQGKVERYRFFEDRVRTLIGKILLLRYLQQHSPYGLEDIAYTSYGKPFIPNTALDFNISHSGSYTIIAFSEENPVGIDIEQIVPKIDLDDFNAILSQPQMQEIAQASDSTQAFFRLWTLKEALLKAEGRGLIDNMQAIKIEQEKVLFEDKHYYALSLLYHEHIFSLVYKDKTAINIRNVTL